MAPHGHPEAIMITNSHSSSSGSSSGSSPSSSYDEHDSSSSSGGGGNSSSKSNSNSNSKGGGGGGDIYAQLNQLEHSLDAELEDLEKFGILPHDPPPYEIKSTKKKDKETKNSNKNNNKKEKHHRSASSRREKKHAQHSNAQEEVVTERRTHALLKGPKEERAKDVNIGSSSNGIHSVEGHALSSKGSIKSSMKDNHVASESTLYANVGERDSSHSNSTSHKKDSNISSSNNNSPYPEQQAGVGCSSSSSFGYDLEEEAERMMLLPPPSSWFTLDDQYMTAPTSSTAVVPPPRQSHNYQQQHSKSNRKDENNNEIISNSKMKANNGTNGTNATNAEMGNSKEQVSLPSASSEAQELENSESAKHNTISIPPKTLFENKDDDDDDFIENNEDDDHSMFNLMVPSQLPSNNNFPLTNTSFDTASTVSQLTAPTIATTATSTSNISTSIETILTISSRTISQTFTQTIPSLVHEVSASAISKAYYKLRSEYVRLGPKRYWRASDIGSSCGRGYYLPASFGEELFRDLTASKNAAANATANANNADGDGASASNNDGNECNNHRIIQQRPAFLDRTTANHHHKRGRDGHLDYMWAHNGAEVRFTTLPWIERQLVHEWRTYEWKTSSSLMDSEMTGFDDDDDDVDDDSSDENNNDPNQRQIQQTKQTINIPKEEDEDQADEDEYTQARTLAPRPLPRPHYENATSCYACREPFRATLHRHHCRRCGHSYCHAHSHWKHPLPHLGYDAGVPERVCRRCKSTLESRDLEERVTWRLARCRDFLNGELTPYFETGVDTVEDAAYRLTQLAIRLARKIPLGAQAYVAIETVEVLRKHGLKGVYGLLLRKEFLAAADLLCRVLGINKKNWPLSVHELSAAIFYALAQHRALRGVRPEGEELIHSLKRAENKDRGAFSDGDNEVGMDGRSVRLVTERVDSVSVGSDNNKSSLSVVHENRAEEEDGEEFDDEAGDEIVYSHSKTTIGRVGSEDSGHTWNHDETTTAANSSQKYLTGELFTSESVLDETDVYDPTSEKVDEDIFAISTATPYHVLALKKSKRVKDNAIQSQDKRQNENSTNSTAASSTTSHLDNKIKTASDDTTNDTTDDATSKLPFTPVCGHVPDSLLSSLLFYAPLALDFIYAECEVDMQLLAAQQGWRLVYASLDQNHHHNHHGNDGNNNSGSNHVSMSGGGGNGDSSDKPASALFAHDRHKIACLSIRGTATIQDVVTDIRAMPVPFPQQQHDDDVNDEEIRNKSPDSPFLDDEEWTSIFRGNGLALCGMAGAASNLFRETADSLLYLALKGYKIRIVGHSLGGGVAALLGILVLRYFEEQNVKLAQDDGFVRVYGYGTPSCVDAKLADHPLTLGLVTSVVMHDDVVPRLTPTSVRGLLKHLLYIRETWVKTHLSDDLNAITERAYHVWPTRLRGSFTLLKKKGVDSAKRLKKTCKKRMIQGRHRNDSSTSLASSNLNDCSENNGGEQRAMNAAMSHNSNNEDDRGNEADTSFSSDEGVDVEGDLFFDPLDDPLNESDDESSVGRNQQHNNTDCDNDWVPFDEPPAEPESNGTKLVTSSLKNDKGLPQIDETQQPESFDVDTSPQILEELPLPRMFIPGQIVHIYTHRGGYKAAFVPRKFRSLRRISMAGNMLSDHMSQSYYEGLLEVKAIRAAKRDLPPWVGFADDCTCSCCASLFTWASTSNTEAQAARDKHNCRACGGLVCDPCSKKRVPIPAIGISAPVRVCDRCYNGWGTLYSGLDDFEKNYENSDEGTSTMAEMQSEHAGNRNAVNPRRSVVVDELASRIPSITS